jgi:phospholipid N-methyltransferase
MVRGIDFGRARYIVEFGPGTGAFTRQILQRRRPETVVLLIERNPEFHVLLQKKYDGEKNLHIVNDTAEQIAKYLAMYDLPHADYIVSGLPFASLPPSISAGILAQASRCLHRDGRFITFQYTLFKKNLIARHFGPVETSWEILNLPPACVLSCRAKPPL